MSRLPGPVLVLGIVLAASACASPTADSARENRAPAAPTITVSGVNASGAALSGSGFVDPDSGAVHTASEWQVVVAGSAEWTPLVGNSGVSTTALTAFVATGLDLGKSYSARVRYRDEHDAFGPFSEPRTFTTASTQSRPPTEAALTVQGTTPTSVTFASSPFADPDVGDTHAATEWQLDEHGGDWSTLVASSVSTTDLTRWTATGLQASARYQARARYRDDKGRVGSYGLAIVVTTPATAAGSLPWTAVSAGDSHSCGLVPDGRAFCWGNGPFLGRQSDQSSPYPVPVETDQRFTSIGAGFQATCAVSTSGPAYCWGGAGSLGDGRTEAPRRPVQVVDVSRFSAAVGGGNNACGLDPSGAAFCWGYNNQWQLGVGDNSEVYVTRPKPVVGGLRFRAISPGDQHTCAVAVDGRGYCWGGGSGGALGSLPTRDRSGSPIEIDGNRSWRKIVPRLNETTAIDAEGRAYVWGLGRFVPVALATDLRFEDLAAGNGYACGLSSGRAYCWGKGYSSAPQGQIPPIVPAGGDYRYVSISAWRDHVCGLTSAGDGWCWGYGMNGELGNGAQGYSNLTPVPVARVR